MAEVLKEGLEEEDYFVSLAFDGVSGLEIARSYEFCAGMVDDIAYDAKLKRVYLSADQFVEVFKQGDADHYTSLGKTASGFRAKTTLFVPELNRSFLAVPRHAKREAEIRVYEPIP